jgi:hypothetical protein
MMSPLFINGDAQLSWYATFTLCLFGDGFGAPRCLQRLSLPSKHLHEGGVDLLNISFSYLFVGTLGKEKLNNNHRLTNKIAVPAVQRYLYMIVYFNNEQLYEAF